MKKKNYILLWSGGFDSTLLLFKLIDKLKENPESKACIISVVAVQVTNSKNHAKNARKEILKLIGETISQDVSERLQFNEVSIDIQHGQDVNHHGVGNTENRKDICHGLIQPSLWTISLPQFLSYEMDNVVLLSYIQGDQALFLQNEIEQMVISNSKFVVGTNFLGHNYASVIVSFPFKYTTKAKVIDNLIEINPKLLDLCVTCQYDQDDNPKCLCDSCTNLRDGLISLYLTNKNIGGDKSIEKTKIISDFLKRRFRITLNIKFLKDTKNKDKNKKEKEKKK